MAGLPLKVVVSGSFHRDPDGLKRIWSELQARGYQVLSPRTLDFDKKSETFKRSHAERKFSARELELWHLEAIDLCDMLWLHCPEGYIGPSTSFEVGYAVALEKPIYALETPVDITLREFVTIKSDISETLGAGS